MNMKPDDKPLHPYEGQIWMNYDRIKYVYRDGKWINLVTNEIFSTFTTKTKRIL